MCVSSVSSVTCEKSVSVRFVDQGMIRTVSGTLTEFGAFGIRVRYASEYGTYTKCIVIPVESILDLNDLVVNYA